MGYGLMMMGWDGLGLFIPLVVVVSDSSVCGYGWSCLPNSFFFSFSSFAMTEVVSHHSLGFGAGVWNILLPCMTHGEMRVAAAAAAADGLHMVWAFVLWECVLLFLLLYLK